MMKHLLFLFIFVFLCIAGCSNTNLSGLVPVSGMVTLDGQPLEEAMLNFQPKEVKVENPRAGVARSDAAGKFRVMTLQPNDGVYPGEYKVIVSKSVEVPLTPQEEEKIKKLIQDNIPIPDPVYKELIPTLYTKFETTPLVITIGSNGDTNLTIELNSKP
jgi:hypothetical protein